MSAKRQATSELNHTNWDREEEPEDRGTFRTAPEEELKNRVIKKARRKIAGSTDAADGASGSASKSVFSGFAGFGKPANTSTAGASGQFSFLSKIAPAPASTATSSSATTKATFSFGGSATTEISSSTTSSDSSKGEDNSSAKSDKSSSGSGGKKSQNYCGKLMGLNKEFSEWIKTQVDKNNLCILTPIFKDYEKYLAEIENEEKKSYKINESSDKVNPPTSSNSALANFKFSSFTSASSTSPPSAPTFSFGSAAAASKTEATTTSTTTTSSGIFGNTQKPATSEAPKSNGFSFGLKTDEKATPSASTGFSFGKPSSTTEGTEDKKSPGTSGFNFKPAGAGAASTGFSFTPGSAPFSFGNIQPPAATTSTGNADEEDEEDQPPKVEFKQVVEEDAVFSKKCKVFVKKDGNFADRGVGTLYLKPVKDSEKTQLLVRADTNLGNILVNLILSAAIPVQRMGKNNVMLVCIPTPDVEKPTPMLLRVKTGEEADELFETIEKYKK